MNTDRRQSFLGSRLFRKFLIWFLLIAITPVILLSYFSYNSARQIIEQEGLSRLISIAEKRVHEINTFFTERERDIAAQVKNPFIINAMENMVEAFTKSGLNSAQYRAEEEKILPFLSVFKEKFALNDLLFISPDGNIVFSLAKEADLGTNLLTDPYEDTELEKAFKFSMTRKKISVSGFKLYEPSGEPTAFATAPVLRDDQVLGIIVFQLDPTLVYDLAANYIGLGKSGEMVIAALDGDNAVVSAPLRHSPQAAFKMKIKIGSEAALPIQDAVKGNEGSGISVDYRGKEILSVWKYIPKASWGIVAKIDTEEIFAPAKSLLNRTLVIGILTVLFVLILAIFVSRSIVNPVIGLKKSLGSIARGEFPEKLHIRSRDEIAEINESMGIVIDSFKEVVSQANVIAEGDYRSDIVLRSDKDELGIALQKMTGSLRTAKEENESNDWLKSGQSELEGHMRGDQLTEDLCMNIIPFVANYLKAQIGALYVNDGDEKFKLQASYAYKTRKNLSNEFKTGEGLIGQAALEKQSIILTNVPDDYITVTSGLGEKKPKNILVVPLIYNETVTGVLEIGSFDEFTGLASTFLEEVSDGIAIAINSAQARVQLQNAFEVTQKQAEDLKSQQEELRAANEELEEQTQALKKSEAKLQVQQEELQVTNEEMEEKNDLLERQKKEVEYSREEIEKKAEELAMASKYKSEFLATMSHELRSPLNSLLLLSQGLTQNKKGNLTEDQVESARIIHGSGSDLLSLIDEILDLSKIEAGRMDLHPGKLLVSDFADSVRASFGHLAEEKGVHLETVISEKAPVEITSDRKRVEQVIRNLVSNAVKFTEKGSVTVSFGRPIPETDLSKSGLAVDDYLAVAVKDTGIGIALDLQKIVFEPFQQADGGISRKYAGTGLGLSISRELARLLGGEILIESEPGKGSTFTLYLPVRFRKSERETGLRSRFQPGGPPGRRGGVYSPEENSKPERASERGTYKEGTQSQIQDDREDLGESDRVILIIEDDPRFAGILRKKCHEKGFKCLAAPTGEAGLGLAAKYLPNAVILDIRLPGMDGWSVLSALKDDTRTRHIPVHIASVEAASAEALRKGALGHVTKPLTQEDMDEIFGRLEQVSSGRSWRVLVVEDNPEILRSTVELIGDGNVHTDGAENGSQALEALRSGRYDCVILDLGLPDMSGNELLERAEREGLELPPVVVHTARDLTREEERELREHAESIVIKDVRSQERLLDEVSLFLHRVVSQMPEKKRKIIRNLHDTDAFLRDKKVLVVDDDMRASFAMSRCLSERGMKTLKAQNGEKALEILDKEPDVDLVIMDIMMPVMDGYEAIRRIRAQERFRNLPILALTAKAMPDDREKCLKAGASDYLPKPVDEGRLISMMRVWLYR